MCKIDYQMLMVLFFMTLQTPPLILNYKIQVRHHWDRGRAGGVSFGDHDFTGVSSTLPPPPPPETNFLYWWIKLLVQTWSANDTLPPPDRSQWGLTCVLQIKFCEVKKIGLSIFVFLYADIKHFWSKYYEVYPEYSC